MPDEISPRDQRIVKHVRALIEAGQDVQRFTKTLEAIRDDANLTPMQRGAILKTLAQENAAAYRTILTIEQE